MSKSIVFNKQQLEAYKNGATMFLAPIVHPLEYYSSRSQQAIRIEPENDPWYKDRNYCIREEGGGWQDFTKQDFLNYVKAPLQKGSEFFIQEDYMEVYNSEDDETPMIMYRQPMKNLYHGVPCDGAENNLAKWQDADKMQEHQARFKDVVLDAEVKRVQDICSSTAIKIHNIIIRPKYHLEYWLEKQGINYDENPYVFLYTVKGKG